MPEKQDTQWVFKTFQKVTVIHAVPHISKPVRKGLLPQSFSHLAEVGKKLQILLGKKKSYFYHERVNSKVFHGLSVSFLSANI